MKAITALWVTASISTIAALGGTVNFDNVPVGKLPTTWTGTKTGNGEAKWLVVADDSAPSKPNVLKQGFARLGKRRRARSREARLLERALASLLWCF